MATRKSIGIGIVGAGGMAVEHAKAFAAMRDTKVVAVCDVVRERVDEFAKRHAIPRAFTDIDDILDDTEVDALCIVTPDDSHADLSIQTIAAGKHVLCEKPLATSHVEALRMARAARRKGIVHMVNFSYRRSGALYRARKLVESGALGEIRHVEASYLQSWLVSPAWGDWRTDPKWLWRLSTRHGSRGTLGDIGVHIVDFATFPVGPVKSVNCTLKTFPKAPRNRVGEYHLDANDSAVIHFEYTNGALGSITATRWATGYANSIALQIHGDKGAVRIDLDTSYDKLDVCRGRATATAEWKTVGAARVPTIYQRFARSILTGEPPEPDFDRGAEVQKVLDTCATSNQQRTWLKV
jgi:predicted dehydrogenase